MLTQDDVEQSHGDADSSYTDKPFDEEKLQLMYHTQKQHSRDIYVHQLAIQQLGIRWLWCWVQNHHIIKTYVGVDIVWTQTALRLLWTWMMPRCYLSQPAQDIESQGLTVPGRSGHH